MGTKLFYDHCSKWEVYDVSHWLTQIGVSEAIPFFTAEKIDGLQLIQLDRTRISRLGSISKSKQEVIWKYINEFNKEQDKAQKLLNQTSKATKERTNNKAKQSESACDISQTMDCGQKSLRNRPVPAPPISWRNNGNHIRVIETEQDTNSEEEVENEDDSFEDEDCSNVGPDEEYSNLGEQFFERNNSVGGNDVPRLPPPVPQSLRKNSALNNNHVPPLPARSSQTASPHTNIASNGLHHVTNHQDEEILEESYVEPSRISKPTSRSGQGRGPVPLPPGQRVPAAEVCEVADSPSDPGPRTRGSAPPPPTPPKEAKHRRPSCPQYNFTSSQEDSLRIEVQEVYCRINHYNDIIGL